MIRPDTMIVGQENKNIPKGEKKMNRIIKPILITVLLLMTAACGKGQQVEPLTPNSEETVLTEETAPSEPEDTTLAEAEETDLSADLVTFENERFRLEHPGNWFSDSLAGLGFFATDAEIQNTWFTEQGPVVENGAAVIVLVGPREDLSIAADASALEVMTSTPLDGSCEWVDEPVGVIINGEDGATSRFVCSSDSGVSTIVISTLILMEDRVGSLTGLVAAKAENELLPLVKTIINSFQFVAVQ